MEQLKKKYLSLTNLLTSSSESSGYLFQKFLIFILIGLILVGFGVLSYKTDMFSNGDTVEVLNATTESEKTTSEIVVEISGSVENPNVYKLPSGSRIDDLLIISGGLSENADRDWVNKNINRASVLRDGQKLYIYQIGETSAKESGSIKLDQGVLGDETGNLVNINTASLSELDTLSGIGPVYAQKIIEGRNYSNLEELVSKGVIGQNLFEKIKNDITY